MKKTFLELQQIDSVIGHLYGNNQALKDTKFGYAYKRFSEKNYTPVLKELQEKLQDVRIDNALSDEKTGAILSDQTNPRGYQFSKEGLKKCIKEENQLLDELNTKEIDVTPFICSEIPELTTEQTELLKGVLI